MLLRKKIKPLILSCILLSVIILTGCREEARTEFADLEDYLEYTYSSFVEEKNQRVSISTEQLVSNDISKMEYAGSSYGRPSNENHNPIYAGFVRTKWNQRSMDIDKDNVTRTTRQFDEWRRDTTIELYGRYENDPLEWYDAIIYQDSGELRQSVDFDLLARQEAYGNVSLNARYLDLDEIEEADDKDALAVYREIMPKRHYVHDVLRNINHIYVPQGSFMHHVYAKQHGINQQASDETELHQYTGLKPISESEDKGNTYGYSLTEFDDEPINIHGLDYVRYRQYYFSGIID